MKNNNWISIEDETPDENAPLLYFFECTGVSPGFYFGINDDYCPETGHQFGGPNGWLTGDVTHWQYFPDGPEGFELDEEYEMLGQGKIPSIEGMDGETGFPIGNDADFGTNME